MRSLIGFYDLDGIWLGRFLRDWPYFTHTLPGKFHIWEGNMWKTKIQLSLWNKSKGWEPMTLNYGITCLWLEYWVRLSRWGDNLNLQVVIAWGKTRFKVCGNLLTLILLELLFNFLSLLSCYLINLDTNLLLKMLRLHLSWIRTFIN